MMETLRKIIVQEPRHFLLLSRTKQDLLVDKMVQRMVSRSKPCRYTDSFSLKKKIYLTKANKQEDGRCSYVKRVSYLLCDQRFVDPFSAGHVHRGVHWGWVSFTGYYGSVCGGWGVDSAGPQLLHREPGFPPRSLLQQQQDGHYGSYPARTCCLRVTIPPITETICVGIGFSMI